MFQAGMFLSIGAAMLVLVQSVLTPPRMSDIVRADILIEASGEASGTHNATEEIAVSTQELNPTATSTPIDTPEATDIPISSNTPVLETTPTPTKPVSTPTPTNIPTTTPTSIPRHTPTVVPTETPMPLASFTSPSGSDVHSMIAEYSAYYDISSDTLSHIAACESGYNPSSYNPAGYAGMFQFSESTWISTRREMDMDENADLRFNAEEAIRTAAYKISRGGIGAWASCAG